MFSAIVIVTNVCLVGAVAICCSRRKKITYTAIEMEMAAINDELLKIEDCDADAMIKINIDRQTYYKTFGEWELRNRALASHIHQN